MLKETPKRPTLPLGGVFRFFLLISICSVVVLALLHPWRPFAAKAGVSLPPLPHGSLHPLLFDQLLSHRAAHTPKFWLHFLSGLQPRAVAIAGVEYGADAANYSAAGYRVHAVEPGTRFVKRLRRRKARHPDWELVVHPYAATNVSNSTLQIEYHGMTVATDVPTKRLDDLIDERLAFLSADVQGGELQILQGASGLLPSRVDSILVELGRCRGTNVQILRLLDKDYVLFDFVPWGQDRGLNDTVFELRNYRLGDERRPGEFAAYDKWLCGERARYRWVQTDVLAVRRDVISQVWSLLAGVGEHQCAKTEQMCVLRSLVEAQNRTGTD